MKRILFLTTLLYLAAISYGQKQSDIKFEKKPLVLKSLGSFYVGGETEKQTKIEMGGFFPEGHISINQMYVNFMVPQKLRDSVSFVFIHGITLSGKTYETTPDGRMGWNEYFARKGHAVYVVDQVGIGRSGFNQKTYNLARTNEIKPAQAPAILRISDENTAMNFRFTTADNNPVAATKFPTDALVEFSKQSIPFTAGTVPNPNPNFRNLSTLAVSLKHTVLVSHSQSGSFPIETALLNPEGIKAIVLVEPGGNGAWYTDEQIKQILRIPVLIIFGDNVENETGVPGHSWKASYDGWNHFVARLNALGGAAKMAFLPETGIKGNSHMLMMDTNNQQIADLILHWLAEHKI